MSHTPMDLIKSYSEENSEEEYSSKSNSPAREDHSPEPDSLDKAESVDYFNLESSDSEGEYAVTEATKIQDTYSVLQNAQILSQEAYGPCKPLECSSRLPYVYKDNGTLNTCGSDPSSRACLPRNNKFLKSDQSTDVSFYNQSSRKTSVNHVDSNQTVTEFWSEALGKTRTVTDSLPPGCDIFQVNINIKYNMANEVACGIPKRVLRSADIHKSSVTSLNWCIDKYSHLLLTASMDSTVKISDVYSLKTIREISSDSAVRSAKWSLSGTKVIFGGYGKTVNIIDIETGKKTFMHMLENYVSSLEVHPDMESVFLVGTRDNVFAFDARDPASSLIRKYSSDCQYVLDIAFFSGGLEFLCSTEVVSHDCADRTLIVWDFATSAVMSNQIYSERYTCPCVKVEPGGSHFIAQSNGDYIAMFSTKRPYKMKNRRYSGHKVSGYSIGCDFSPDGSFIASGDADGGLYIYSNDHCCLVKKNRVKTDIPTVQVKWHPVMYSTVATASLDGSVQIWQ